MKTKKLLRFLRIKFWIRHPKAKERNSGVIMDELCVAVQILVCRRSREVAISGEHIGSGSSKKLANSSRNRLTVGAKSEAIREQLKQENIQYRQFDRQVNSATSDQVAA